MKRITDVRATPSTLRWLGLLQAFDETDTSLGAWETTGIKILRITLYAAVNVIAWRATDNVARVRHLDSVSRRHHHPRCRPRRLPHPTTAIAARTSPVTWQTMHSLGR